MVTMLYLNFLSSLCHPPTHFVRIQIGNNLENFSYTQLRTFIITPPHPSLHLSKYCTIILLERDLWLPLLSVVYYYISIC